MHWHSLTKKHKEQILESHIFVEQKRDGKIKARKVIGGNKQRDYITKEDVSSPTVTAEAVMLTCVICCKYLDTLSTLGPHSSPNTPNTMYS